MMRFLQLLNKRQSVRRYSAEKVEKEKIDLCLEAARLSPSACNSQPWHFIIVDDDALRDQVAAETYGPALQFNKFTRQAPLLLVIVIEKAKLSSRLGTKIKQIDYPLIDIGIAAEHFCLQAAELGLGSCMIGWFNEKPIKKILGIPEKKKIGLLITVGYPEKNYRLRKKTRKKLNDITGFNKY